MNKTVNSMNPIVIPGLKRASIRMISEQYKIPYTKLYNRFNYYKDQFDYVIPMTKNDFESMIAKDIQFVCKTEHGVTGYLFTNAAFASIKFKSTALLAKDDIPKLLKLCEEDARKMPKPKKETPVEEAKPVVEEVKEPEADDIFDDEENQEDYLCLNLAKAYKSGEIMNVLSAALALDGYRKREIKELTAKIKPEDSYIPWTEKQSANRAVNTLADILGAKRYDVWCEVYDRLLNNYKIDLRARKKKPLIDGFKTNEWHLFYQAFVDICNNRYLNIKRVFDKAEINTDGLSVMVGF